MKALVFSCVLLVSVCLSHAEDAILLRAQTAQTVRGGYSLGYHNVPIGSRVSVLRNDGVNAQVFTKDGDTLIVSSLEIRLLPKPTPPAATRTQAGDWPKMDPLPPVPQSLASPSPSPSVSPPPLTAQALIASIPAPPPAKSAEVAAHDQREAETYAGLKEGRRVGNNRYREGFPRPSLDYLDAILSTTLKHESEAWKLGFKGGYLSAWENHGQDL